MSKENGFVKGRVEEESKEVMAGIFGRLGKKKSGKISKSYSDEITDLKRKASYDEYMESLS